MGRVHTTRTVGAGRWSSTLILVGGGLILCHAAVRGIEAFTATTPPPDVFAPTGYLLALVGLLGLYPGLVDRTPRLARVAALVAAVPLVGWILLTAGSVGELVGVLPPGEPILPGAFIGLHMVGVILTYLLFGLATLRAGRHSMVVVSLLLAPPALFVVMIVGAAAMGNAASGAFVVGSALAVVHLAIGTSLRTGVRSADESMAGDAVVD